MSQLTVRLHSSLEDITDSELEAFEDDIHPFFGRYLRLITPQALRDSLGGARFEVLAARRDGKLVALCPVLEVDGAVAEHYSLEWMFFTGWQDDLQRQVPRMAPFVSTIRRVARGIARTADTLGITLRRSILAIAPFTYHGGVALVSGAGAPDIEAGRAVVKELVALGRRRGLVVGVMGIRQDCLLRSVYVEEGLIEIPRNEDFRYDLPGASVEDWLAGLSAISRKARRREMKQFKNSGVTITRECNVSPALARAACDMYTATYARHSDKFFRHTPEFFAEASCLPFMDLLVARRGDELVGMVLLGRGRDVIALRVGEPLEKVPGIYFTLALYEPMRRAYATGRPALWLGPGNAEYKVLRGAKLVPFLSYFATPNRKSAAIFGSWLRAYARVVTNLMSAEAPSAR